MKNDAMAQSIAYQHLRESCEASTLNLMLRNGNVGEPHPPYTGLFAMSTSNAGANYSKIKD